VNTASEKTKIYFVSDSHLGVPDTASSREREKLLVAWLDSIKAEAAEIYLLGDIFDFWFEYSKVVPKGFVRLLGKLAELSDAGIRIHYFTGNHDMWMFDYFPEELGIEMFREPQEREINGKKFLIAHGDGMGAKDLGYKFIKKIFAARFCQWLFARIHPNTGVRLALYFSRKSRVAQGNTDEKFLGAGRERLIVYAGELVKEKNYDFLIFGHRHLPFDVPVGDHSRYINLGDWVSTFTFAMFDGEQMHLHSFLPEMEHRIIRNL
jgi:UDP-2,3-diacylglucosamine hydrolase